MQAWIRYALGVTVAMATHAAIANDLYQGQIAQPLVSDRSGILNLPQGFKAFPFAKYLGRARHIVVRGNGDVYVSLRQSKQGHSIVALRDTDQDDNADIIEYFGESALHGTGIDIYQNYLYVASESALYRYALTDGELLPQGEPEIVLTGFPRQSSHAAKPFVFDSQGWLYINSGAPSNACQERLRTPGSPGQRPCPELELTGGIWRYPADALMQVHSTQQRYVTGVRHAVALDWHPLAKQLFLVMHGRDQLDALWPAYYDTKQNAELPAEEFHALQEGSDLGWPYTYYDSENQRRLIAPEYGGDGNTVDESGQYQQPAIGLPAHWAPNDLLFYTGSQFPELYRGGAFIAFHGSWNRSPLPQGGYNVVFAPFNAEYQATGEWFVFADGFIGRRSELRSPGQAQHRPMGLAQDPQGALYVTDSVEGHVWKIEYAE